MMSVNTVPRIEVDIEFCGFLCVNIVVKDIKH